MLALDPSRLAQVFPTPHLAQVCFGASVPNAIIKPKRKLRGIMMPLQFYRFATGFKKRNALNLRKQC